MLNELIDSESDMDQDQVKPRAMLFISSTLLTASLLSPSAKLAVIKVLQGVAAVCAPKKVEDSQKTKMLISR